MVKAPPIPASPDSFATRLTAAQPDDVVSAALARLETVTADAQTYAMAWITELQALGASAGIMIDPDGTVALTTGQRCDERERERRTQMDALCEHMRAQPGARAAILDCLQRAGLDLSERAA